MIVAAQDLAPNAMGAASGLMMGFTWGMAGVLYIGIGALQEVLGVQTAMALSFLTLIPGAILAYAVLQRNRAAIDAAN
jgi:FSR family fosmidomycin resistance protein-like MFS transporter